MLCKQTLRMTPAVLQLSKSFVLTIYIIDNPVPINASRSCIFKYIFPTFQGHIGLVQECHQNRNCGETQKCTAFLKVLRELYFSHNHTTHS